MIIDLILDRKDGYRYNAHEFYGEVMEYGEVGFDIPIYSLCGMEYYVNSEGSIQIVG